MSDEMCDKELQASLLAPAGGYCGRHADTADICLADTWQAEKCVLEWDGSEAVTDLAVWIHAPRVCRPGGRGMSHIDREGRVVPGDLDGPEPL